MSKIIKLTPEMIESVKQDFSKYLETGKISEGKIQYDVTLPCASRKANLYFTPLAWAKMKGLVDKFSEEVAWHGLARRGDDEEKDDYFIEDIIVYPQEVTGASVNTDQAKYEQWLMQFDDDAFNRIRMQGHSHVRMAVTPSGVDLTHQSKILSMLDDEMFYIFLIANKNGDMNIKIYDLKKNVLFETNDVSVSIEGVTGIDEFIKDAQDKVQRKTYQYNYTPPITSLYGGANNTSAEKKDKKNPDKRNKKMSFADFLKKEEDRALANLDDDDDPYGPYGYMEEWHGGYRK